jgi:TolA-binding protein
VLFMILVQSHLQPSSGNKLHRTVKLIMVFLMLGAWAGTRPAFSQDTGSIPTIPFAETAFNLGIVAYEHGDYAGAHDRFMQVITDYTFNRRTTAAHLMAGKAPVYQRHAAHSRWEIPVVVLERTDEEPSA